MTNRIEKTAPQLNEMENRLIPYDSVKKIDGSRALVLAPHPDDEVFGCGGAIMCHVAAGDAVHVVIASNGEYRAGDAPQAAYADQRKEESSRAASVLDYGVPEFWGLPDRGIEYGEFLVRRIADAIDTFAADMVYAPSIHEMHPDHRALGMAAVEAVRRHGGELKLAMYEVGVPMARPNLLLDISELRERKQAAMACFSSQLKEQPYDQHIAALNRFRTYTLPSQVTAAEAYFLAAADDLGNDVLKLYDSEYQQQRELGLPLVPRDVPLVSVLIRSMDRPTLTKALDSVALQTYSNIEVVVANAKGSEHHPLDVWCGRFPIRLAETGNPLQRSQAANVAMEEAKGDYLIFLDDDDWFEPHHVSALVDRIRQVPGIKAVYSNIRVVGAQGEHKSHVFKDEFDPIRMMADNLIPIHAVLFNRSLVEAGCHFDETLDVYEDWDFWLQVARHTSFSHVDQVGACYLAAGNSQVGPQGTAEARRQARQLVFEKWKGVWSGEEINALLAYKDSMILAKGRELDSTAQILREQLKSQERALSDQTSAHASVVESLNRRQAESESRAVELQRRVDELLSSTSWRVTAPLRWGGERVRNFKYLFALGGRFVRANGGGVSGVWKLALKSASALSKHGPLGLVYKIKAYARHAGASASAFVPVYLNTCPASLAEYGVLPHGQSVDIIVCVHNALDDVKRCLESVVSHTFPPYSLILVDDGSQEATKNYLEQFAVGQGAQLIRNQDATGYTLAANQGLRSSTADYVVLLNSDTVASPQWLDRMILCAESDPGIGLVGPLSNTASWQSVPELLVNGEWADNELPQWISIQTMATLVAARSARIYPRMPLLNGFCMLVKRQLMDSIGIFDEESFAQGYGEENDYCLRARESGWSLAVADDVYVYHAQSRSYSHERRKILSQRAGEILARKHGQPIIDGSVAFCRYDRVLEGMRARIRDIAPSHRLRLDAKTHWEGKRVLFILPTADAGGGSNVVISEALALIGMGIDVRLLNFVSNQSAFEYSYPKLNIPRIYVVNEAELIKVAGDFDAVIATVNTTVRPLAELVESMLTPPVIGYYIQDFEPLFYKEGSTEYRDALRSYSLIPAMVRLTKTTWNQQILQEKVGVNCTVIGPSLNLTLFYPRPRREASWPDRPLRIVAMIRPYTPRRAPRLTMEVLRDAYRKYGERIEIVLFGEETEQPDFRALPLDFQWKNLGKQNSRQLALLMNESDIFVDFSEYQAMGLTAMEAMACGVAVIVPESGGATSFAAHEENALFVDSSSRDECLMALCRLIEDDGLRASLQQRAISDVARYRPDVAVFNMMQALFSVTDGRP